MAQIFSIHRDRMNERALLPCFSHMQTNVWPNLGLNTPLTTSSNALQLHVNRVEMEAAYMSYREDRR